MHFTQILTVALSLSAAAVSAAPAPLVKGATDGPSKLVHRSIPASDVAARSTASALSHSPLQSRGLDPVTHLRRAIDLKFGDLKPEARDLALVTELHRRGLLDQLVAALRDLILTLLGQGGGMTRRQASVDQIEQAVQQITCILDALFGNADSTCDSILGSATNGTNGTTAKSPLEQGLAQIGAQLRNASSITQVVSNFMPPTVNLTATEKAAKSSKSQSNNSDGKKQSNKHSSDKNATAASTSTTSTQDKRSVHLLQERQTSGVEGLLVSLRDVIDTILNTLLPMSSRDEDSSSTASASSARWPPQDCPPPTPNDGMYRPGCPGYGRRDLAIRRSMQELGERDASVLQAVLPMIEMLLQQIPALIENMYAGNSSASSWSPSAVSSVTGAAKASPTNSNDTAFSQIVAALMNGAGSSSVSNAAPGMTASSSASSAKATATASSGAGHANQAARSAANLSRNQARDLLEADGMNLGKRQTTGATTDGTDAVGSDNCDASGNSGGINLSLLNNLLNGLLGGFSRRDEMDADLVSRRQTGATDGTNSIGSGNCNAGNNTGGINVSLLDNLLNGLLSGFSRRGLEESSTMIPVEMLKRDVADSLAASAAAPLMEARADFSPVWAEIKKIGNEAFHTAGSKREEMAASTVKSFQKRTTSGSDAPDFAPVWEAFRDLVDNGLSQAGGAQRRDGSNKLDYKPLINASAKWAGQVFKSFRKQHAKRSTDFKPLLDAANQFASKAIQEMMTAAKKSS